MAGWRVDELVSELDVPCQNSETPLLSKLKDPRVGLSAQSLVTDVSRVVPSRAQRRRHRSRQILVNEEPQHLPDRSYLFGC
jgi:hypothetical protein